MRIRSTKPEFVRAGDLDPNDAPSWRAVGVGRSGGTFVYRFFSASGQFLYVGFTWNPWVRWRVHRKEKPWWNEVAVYDLHRCVDDRAAREFETWCIRNMDPLHNKHQNRRWYQSGKNQDDQARVLG